MSCFIPPKISLPSLPGLPDIKIPNASLPNLPDLDLSFPSFGLPDIFFNWHPNLCDLLILIYIIYLLLSGSTNPNPSLDETMQWVSDITSSSTYFGNSNDTDVNISPAYTQISVVAFRPKVYPHDRDLIMKSIYDNYDSNNEFGDATTSGTNTTINEMCAIFELNNLDCDEISNYYELKKTQFTRNVKLTRV